MVNKSTYLSETVWRGLDKELRKAILAVLPQKKSDIVATSWFISTLEGELRARGEHGLADMLLAEVVE